MFSGPSKELKEETIKKRSFKNLPASTSLNSLDSTDEEVRKESKPIVLTAESIETKSSDSEQDSIEDENSNESDTTEDDADLKPVKPQTRKI